MYTKMIRGATHILNKGGLSPLGLISNTGLNIRKQITNLGMVMHTCNPIYLQG